METTARFTSGLAGYALRPIPGHIAQMPGPCAGPSMMDSLSMGIGVLRLNEKPYVNSFVVWRIKDTIGLRLNEDHAANSSHTSSRLLQGIGRTS